MERCHLLTCSPTPACSDYCLTELRTTNPGMIPPKMGWAFPHQSLTKIILYRIACSPVLGIFLIRVPSSQMTVACVVNIKLTSTPENTLGSKGKDSQKRSQEIGSKIPRVLEFISIEFYKERLDHRRYTRQCIQNYERASKPSVVFITRP